MWNVTAQIQPKLTTSDVEVMEIKIDKAKQQKTRWNLGSVLDQEPENLNSVSVAMPGSAGDTSMVFAQPPPQLLLGNAPLSHPTQCFQWGWGQMLTARGTNNQSSTLGSLTLN